MENGAKGHLIGQRERSIHHAIHAESLVYPVLSRISIQDNWKNWCLYEVLVSWRIVDEQTYRSLDRRGAVEIDTSRATTGEQFIHSWRIEIPRRAFLVVFSVLEN